MLAVLLLGQFMCIIDVLVVNVAMPSIAAGLQASGASLQLIVGGYFTGPARARALSAYAAVLSAGAVAGLVLGVAAVGSVYLSRAAGFRIPATGRAAASAAAVMVRAGRTRQRAW
jgi:hypothetical protein